MAEDKIPDVAAADLLNPCASGYLEKKRPTKKFVPEKFQRRWCVIYKRVFYYYEKPTDRKQRGAFPLKGYKVKPSDLDDLCFILENSMKERTYQFKAPSRDEITKWRQAVFNASRGGKHYSSVVLKSSPYEDVPRNIPVNRTTPLNIQDSHASRSFQSNSRSQEDLTGSYDDARRKPSMSPSNNEKPSSPMIKQRNRAGSCPVIQNIPPISPEIKSRTTPPQRKPTNLLDNGRTNSSGRNVKTKRFLPPVQGDFDFGNTSESFSDFSDSEVSIYHTRRKPTSPLVSNQPFDSVSMKSSSRSKSIRRKALPDIPDSSLESDDHEPNETPPIPARPNANESKGQPPPPLPIKRGHLFKQPSITPSISSSYPNQVSDARSDEGDGTYYESSTDYESVDDESDSSNNYEDVERVGQIRSHYIDDESIYSRVVSGILDYDESDGDEEGYITKINKRSSSHKRSKLLRKSKTSYSYNVSGIMSDENESYVHPKDNVFLHDENGYLIIVPISVVEDDHVEYATIESVRASRNEDDIYSCVGDFCLEPLQSGGIKEDNQSSTDSDDCSGYVNLRELRQIRKRSKKHTPDDSARRGRVMNDGKAFSYQFSLSSEKKTNLKMQGSFEDESNISSEEYDCIE